MRPLSATIPNFKKGLFDLPGILTIAILIASFFALVVLQMALHAKRPLQYALGGIGMGICALAAVNLTSFFTGVSLPISVLTLSVSAAGGIPGVTAMLLLNLFFVI